jgi:hypothetical protein
MKRVFFTAAILLLTGGLALAQAGGGGAGGAGGGATGPGAGAGTGGGTVGGTGPVFTPTNPNGSPAANDGTVGQAPGGNPSNPQDLINRNNAQDLTKPGGGNPQDLKR